jgi:phosphatidylethanolamine/phosphatidyl-N-methylethanolamine N-methyltransferase
MSSTQIISSFTTFFAENLYTDVTEKNFLWSVFHALLNFSLWILLPHLEFKYRILSRLTNGDQGKACDFLSFLLIQTGALRNLAFNEAINQGNKIKYGNFDFALETIGVFLIIGGFSIVFLTFYRMGIRGMYFGDHFGFLFKEKITAFPFSHLDNPQYVGTTAFFLGSSIFYHSPAGVVLTVLTYGLYMVLNLVEEKKLAVFYPVKK